jgi:hypothetical protein
MKRIFGTCPAIAAPSRAEKCNGVQSRIAAIMERASAASSAGPAPDRTKTNLRPAYDGAFPGETDANRDLIVVVRWTPAGS